MGSGGGSRAAAAYKGKVTVVGAGFSGLVSAFHLNRAGYAVEVIEKSAEAGGLIRTLENDLGRVETAANGLLNSLAVEELFSAIGLPVQPTLKESRRRFIFRQGRPRRWPFGLRGAFSLLWFLFRFSFFRSRVAPKEGETVREWGHRAMGEELTSFGLEAALQGIYAGDPDRMSASLIFGRLFQKGPRTPGPSSGVRGTVSAPLGMGQLITRLRSHLEEQGVGFRMGESYVLPAAQGGDRLTTPHVIATSAHEAAELLGAIDPERASHLAAVEMAPVLTATIFFDQPVPAGARGFGVLFPPRENKPMLGVLMNDCIFPNRAKRGFSETWIFGGAVDEGRALQRSDQEIFDVVDKERVSCFQTQAKRLGANVTRWPRALPHYTVDLERRMSQIRRNRFNVFLIGNYLGDIGLAKILERARRLPSEIESTDAATTSMRS
jgi:protoporphyrinogen/coproporphyrinogen III oxidase